MNRNELGGLDPFVSVGAEMERGGRIHFVCLGEEITEVG